MTLKEKLIAQAQKLGLKTDKLTIAQLQAALKAHKAEAESGEGTVEPVAAESSKKEALKEEEAPKTAEETHFAKAGKRSQKQVAEAEAKLEKEARKKEAADQPVAKAKPLKPPRSRSERRSKKYKDAFKKIEKGKLYTIEEGLSTILETSITKFDGSVDLVVALGVNIKLADQNIRDFVFLPEGIGKKVTIAVFAGEEEAKAALAAGAEIAGDEVFLQQLEKGVLNFDILITKPDLMVRLSKYAKVLGPKGLMPNAKSGTIVKDVVRAVKEVQSGRVEYRVDEYGLVHLSIGRVSFGAEKLNNNLQAVLKSIKDNKPTNFKGVYLKRAHLSTTMGPGLELALSSLP